MSERWTVGRRAAPTTQRFVQRAAQAAARAGTANSVRKRASASRSPVTASVPAVDRLGEPLRIADHVRERLRIGFEDRVRRAGRAAVDVDPAVRHARMERVLAEPELEQRAQIARGIGVEERREREDHRVRADRRANSNAGDRSAQRSPTTSSACAMPQPSPWRDALHAGAVPDVPEAEAAPEIRPFLGDDRCYDTIARLAPLLAAEPPIGPHTRLALADLGRRVLAGERDFVNGDRWIGGVHVQDGRRRWDEGTETIMG